MTNINDKVYFLEYSRKQGYFHIDSLDRILRNNEINCFSEHSKVMDWAIIYGPDNYEECQNALVYFVRKYKLAIDKG